MRQIKENKRVAWELNEREGLGSMFFEDFCYCIDGGMQSAIRV